MLDSLVLQVISVPVPIVSCLVRLTPVPVSIVPRVLQLEPALLQVSRGTCRVIPASFRVIPAPLQTGQASLHVIPAVCVLPARDGADRFRSVARAAGDTSDDIGVPTDDLGVVTVDAMVPAARTGLSASDAWFTTDDVIMRQSPEWFAAGSGRWAGTSFASLVM